MTGTVELDADGTHLLIRFPYRPDLVEEVRALPGRRWDPRQKTWRVPRENVELVYATFARHLFEFSADVSGLLAGTLGEAAAGAAAAPTLFDGAEKPADGDADAGTAAEAPAALTISALNEQVRDALRQRFPQRLWVTGEVSDFDKGAGRKHRYFQLIEKAKGASRPQARVEAALFESTMRGLLRRLEQQAPDFQLQDGIEIRALVRVDLYPASGRYQVIVEDIDPSFTLGRMALLREEILRELQARGLAERNKALALPCPALRIGVLTSAESDGWNDFLRHLEEAAVGFDVTLFPVRVQGPELQPTVLAGLRWFAERAADFDAVCILRGGGSRADLAWFDNLEVAVAAAQLPIKVLVGIGHQRDQSVLDLIAHSEKTPTAVAERLVAEATAARRAVGEQAARLLDAVEDRLVTAGAELVAAARQLQHGAAIRVARERHDLAAAARRARLAAPALVTAARRQLVAQARSLHGSALLVLERRRARLRAAAMRAARGAALRVERAHTALGEQAARQRLLDPARVLARGFALVRDEYGRVLPSARGIQPRQLLSVQLRDGTVRTRAESVERQS